FAQPAADVNSPFPNGQVTYGNITFNGDGSLQSVTMLPPPPVSINWTDGALPSTIAFNWGTAGQPFGTPNATSIGKTDGLEQFNSAYNVASANQNGSAVGSLTAVSIDATGFITASFSNGETKNLYQIPLASFTSPDNLTASSGNVYAQSSASGQVALVQAGTNPVGAIASSSLEASNVELATQLTDMIVAQSAYQASTKVIATANTLLGDLNQIIQ
ncbi:MAG: flagellar hook-basal body complex protein, partial [Isosphaeraceae bacterium]